MGALGLSLLSSSCSVVVNDFPEQCQTNRDCEELAAKQPLNPDGTRVSGLICTEEHVCELKGCRSNAECQDANEGEPYLCRKSDRTCQPMILKSPDDPETNICDVLADPDDFRNESTIWIGADVIFAPGSWQGLELVRQDFNKPTPTLPPATATGRDNRPLGFVYCEADPEITPGAEASPGHLVDTLELPIVITSLDTSSEIALLQDYSLKADPPVFQVSTSAGGERLKTIDNQDMLVDLVLINENYPKETRELLENYYLDHLRTTGHLGADETPRVAVIHSSTATYSSLSVSMLTELRASSAIGNRDDVRDFGYGDTDNPSGSPAEYPGVVRDVLEFKPHLIVILGDEEIGPSEETMSDGIDVPIEAGWGDAAGDQPRPLWLGILGTVGQIPKDMRTLDTAAQLEWGSRTLFIQQHYDFEGDFFTDYYTQLEQLLNGNDPNDVLGTEKSSPYNEFLREGAYLTAYSIALVAANGLPMTGPNVAAAARGFGRDKTTHFPIGPNDIFRALQHIRDTGESFILDQFQGWTHFDENGFAQYPFADDVACLTAEEDPDTMMTAVGALQPTGGIFDHDGVLTGVVLPDGCVTP